MQACFIRFEGLIRPRPLQLKTVLNGVVHNRFCTQNTNGILHLQLINFFRDTKKHSSNLKISVIKVLSTVNLSDFSVQYAYARFFQFDIFLH